MPSRARAQSGAGLIEVLVAVLILSIGFLGIAALQAKSLSTNNSAMARSMATIESYTILDSMRADINTAVANGYNGTWKGNACPAAGSSLSSVQINQWCTHLGADLGATANTIGTIACTPASGTNSANCTVTIQFDDSRAGLSGTSTQQVVTQALL
ncbi:MULTISPECIES: type IV pilus modification protein PilV [unclassified Dyella]|jgi:type IV pilus assembly protein PilV|uniref:type IV pilus modification protein PilV n=1 Tax=unclassified Dyella TaxID=2634549 RepID=UPI003F8F8E88